MTKKIKANELQAGDILFYRKTKFLNKAISFFDDCKYNHNAIYLGNNMVIESIISGTVVRDVETSIEDAKKVLVKRLHDAPQDMDPVINRSKEYEGDRYAYEEIIMLALICTVRKIRLGKLVSRFIEKILETAGAIILVLTNGNKEALTCSELVYRCYDEAESGHEDSYAIHLNRFDDEEMIEGSNKTVHKESILAGFFNPDELIKEEPTAIESADYDEEQLSKSFKKLKKKYKKGKMTDVEQKDHFKKSLGSFISTANQSKNTDLNNMASFIRENANFVTPGDLYNALNLDEVGILK